MPKNKGGGSGGASKGGGKGKGGKGGKLCMHWPLHVRHHEIAPGSSKVFPMKVVQRVLILAVEEVKGRSLEEVQL